MTRPPDADAQLADETGVSQLRDALIALAESQPRAGCSDRVAHVWVVDQDSPLEEVTRIELTGAHALDASYAIRGLLRQRAEDDQVAEDNQVAVIHERPDE